MADGNDVVTDILVRNLLELFNEKDGAVRRALLAELWSENAVFIDPDAIHRGPESIDRPLNGSFNALPASSSLWQVAGPVRSQHGVACLPLASGSEETPRQVTGIDIGVIEQGKLAPSTRSSTKERLILARSHAHCCGKGHDCSLLEDVSPRNLDGLAVDPTVLFYKKTCDNAADIFRFPNPAKCRLSCKHRFKFFIEATTQICADRAR